MRQPNLQKIADLEAEIERLKVLLTRAADILERSSQLIGSESEAYRFQGLRKHLIQELRKAAE